MLINLSPNQAFQKIEELVNQFSADQVKAKNALEEERLKRIADIMTKRNEENQNKNGKSI